MKFRLHSENKYGVHHSWEGEFDSRDEALQAAHDEYSYTEDWWVEEM